MADQKSGNVQVIELSEEKEGGWERFVMAHPEATFFHRAGWRRVIEKAFGFKTKYVYAEREGTICGILPLVHTGKGLFGNRLVSTSFCVQGGPLANDMETRQALDEYALALAEELGVDWLEFRSTKRARPEWACRDDLYYLFRRSIGPNPDANLKSIPRKQRAAVRKALDENLLKVQIDEEPDRFYKVYAVSVRNLGSPIFSIRYCEELKREFGQDCEFMTVDGPSGRPVSSVLSFYFRNEVLPYYGGGTAESRDLNAQPFMYYRLMCRAGDRGARIFDFGRSKQGTGAFSFKKNFGFDPQPLEYEYKLIRGATIPETTTLNPRFQKVITLWQRLPLAVTNLIGPYLVKRLG